MEVSLLNTFQMFKAGIFVDWCDGTILIGKANANDLAYPRTEEVCICRNRFDRVAKEVKEQQRGKVFEQFWWIWEGLLGDFAITNEARDS
jgi:hypothetical protein